tara:strand:+ start:2218 stop:2388 length:171 start_codon:yes stop_codon:yes gene_type:complete
MCKGKVVERRGSISAVAEIIIRASVMMTLIAKPDPHTTPFVTDGHNLWSKKKMYNF